MAGPYGFTNTGANAGNAILQFLMQQDEAKRRALIDELTRQEQTQTMDLRGREMALREGDAARRAQQDATAAEEQATAKRAAQNTIGVRSMIAEGMADPSQSDTIERMAYAENLPVPGIIQRRQAQTDEAQQRSAGLADYESKAMIDASVEAQNPDDAPWQSAGSGQIFNRGSGQFRTAPQTGGGEASNVAGGDQPSRYAMETAQRTITAIDDVLPKISGATAGMGSLMKNIPGSDAANVSAELSSVAANVAFNAIQAMREASKTGGALGQVSERELDLLSAVEGSIRQNQSPENLKANLMKIRESMTRFQQAAGTGGTGGSGGRQRWGRDAQGNPVRQ